MISKELLSAMLGYEADMRNYEEGQVSIQLFVDGRFNVPSMNIYELACRCKKWMYEEYTVVLESSYTPEKSTVVARRGDWFDVQPSDSEVNAIFGMCEHIYKYHNKDSERE